MVIPADEPDKVSELIVKVINDGAFEFTPEYYISIHARIFKGVLPFAGRLRKVNIRKREWMLRDESVTYGSALTLRASLARCFADEREFDYSRLSARKMIPHFCRFIAQVWQIHPFGEGNTRTTAVFVVKYLLAYFELFTGDRRYHREGGGWDFVWKDGRKVHYDVEKLIDVTVEQMRKGPNGCASNRRIITLAESRGSRFREMKSGLGQCFIVPCLRCIVVNRRKSEAFEDRG